MASTAVNSLVRTARQAALGQTGAGLTDAALLDAFIQARDETAFAALVRRHGPMVLGVCRRVLRNDADAEDAFQATFLILARKAASIRSPGAVANWLYGVAHTTAVKAHAMIRKRRTHERRAATMPKSQACEEVWHAVQALLDAELAALPDRYRTAVVLCALEGKTIHDAAQQLGWPQGTVASRLARGRALLARRLAKHGLAVSAGVLVAALTHSAAAGQVPLTLVLSTAKAGTLLAAGQAAAGLVSAQVAALTQGVLQAMFLGKLKLCIAGVVVVTMLGAGTASWRHGTSAGEAFAAAPGAQDDKPPAKQTKQAADPAKLQAEIDRLRLQLEDTQLRLQEALAKIRVLQAEITARAEADRKRAPDGQQNGKPAATATAPDGRVIANAAGQAVELVDAQSGKVLWRMMGHTGAVTALAFAPDGKRLVSGGRDNAVLCWDIQTGRLLHKVATPGPVTIHFSADGRTITFRDRDQTEREVDAATGKVLRVIREKEAAK